MAMAAHACCSASQFSARASQSSALHARLAPHLPNSASPADGGPPDGRRLPAHRSPRVHASPAPPAQRTLDGTRACRCECDCSRASSSHLNFQLPSRSFAGFERAPIGGGAGGAGGAGGEPGDLECKSASYNPQFGAAERARQRRRQDEGGVQPNLGFYLHDLMDQAGIDTTYSRAARAGFTGEVAKLQKKKTAGGAVESAESAVDAARAALEISAEDDALVSHSSVPLPVDSYLERLDGMAAEFARHHLPSSSTGIFEALEKYLWHYKGFRSTEAGTSWDARDFYLNGVLTRRRGPPLMLGLIFSEVVERLWRSGAVDFLVHMIMPIDERGVPRPAYKNPYGPARPGAEDRRDGKRENWADLKSLSPNLLTSENVLFEVLRSLKRLYWPWRSTPGSGQGSDFLEAAKAASRGVVATASPSRGPFESLFNAPASERGSEVAGARAAQYRLQRGIWTSTAFGDLRRALAASERLVILGGSKQEHRDYGMLLFHAGLYEQAFQYLNSYSTKVHEAVPCTFNIKDAKVEAKEAAALDGLLERLQLILTERSWSNSSDPPPPIVSPPDPW